MQLRDLFLDTLRTLWTHKLRTFLTMFGIAWGVVSIMLMVENLLLAIPGFGCALLVAPGLERLLLRFPGARTQLVRPQGPERVEKQVSQLHGLSSLPLTEGTSEPAFWFGVLRPRSAN